MDTASRVIMHLDMDAFFASVEQVDQPELQGKPVIVGGSRDRGVVSAASYEARQYGVHSAMPMYTACRLCPHGVFLKGRMGRYVEISRRIMDLLREYSPRVEPASIDEAYVDLTGTGKLFGPPRSIAEEIKRRILEAHRLTCSIGLAPNKFVAKIASAWNKPDGITEVQEGSVLDFLQDLPLSKLPGVGRKTLSRLERFNVHCVGDIRRFPAEFWEERLGKLGSVLVQRAWGEDPSLVVPVSKRKSCGAENTFARDISDPEELRRWLLSQSEEVGETMRRKGLLGRTITLKVKFNDFGVVSKSETLAEATAATRTIFHTACRLLAQTELRRPVRLTGVTVSHFSTAARRVSLFPENEASRRQSQQLDRAVDAIRQKYGSGALQWAFVHNLQQTDEES